MTGFKRHQSTNSIGSTGSGFAPWQEDRIRERAVPSELQEKLTAVGPTARMHVHRGYGVPSSSNSSGLGLRPLFRSHTDVLLSVRETERVWARTSSRDSELRPYAGHQPPILPEVQDSTTLSGHDSLSGGIQIKRGRDEQDDEIMSKFFDENDADFDVVPSLSHSADSDSSAHIPAPVEAEEAMDTMPTNMTLNNRAIVKRPLRTSQSMPASAFPLDSKRDDDSEMFSAFDFSQCAARADDF